VLGSTLKALETHGPDVNAGFGDPASIGRLLLEKFLLPFEASSILLLLAAVGAIVLAARRREAEGEAPSKHSPTRLEGASPSAPHA
jgi:NADH-quinone oxidoreductase subunit J